jgi:D-alanyl-D-alanine dipeptidase
VGNVPIHVEERENPVDLVLLEETERIFLNDRVADDWRIRRVVRDKIVQCSHTLPDGLCLMIFEAFRSRARQQELWTPVYAGISAKHPNWTKDAIYQETSRWVSPPDGLGSGHQAGAAIDVTLAHADRRELDMGTSMQEFAFATPTASDVPDGVRRNRDLLVQALQSAGLVNYPDEWWHFSYGDRLWAEVTKRDHAFFAPIE